MKQAHENFVAEFDKNAVSIGMSVEIEFGNNRFNDHQICTASSTKDETRGIENFIKKNLTDFWKPDQAFNNKNHNTLKWLVCDAGATLDAIDNGATYRCIDPDHIDDMELGWWSSTRSHATTGVFGTPQWVKSEWFEDDGTTPKGRLVNKFAIYFDEAYPNMKFYQAEYKNSLGDWIELSDDPVELGLDEYTVEIPNPETDPIMVYGLRLTITATHEVDDYARVSEFNAFYVEEFTDATHLVSADVSEVREQYEGQRPIGTTAANSFDFELDNTDQLFSFNNESSPYAQYLVENCKVIPRIWAAGHSVKMGEFWTDDWSEDGSSMSMTVNCRDFSKFLQDVPENFGRVWEDTNATVPFVEMLSYAGVRYADMIIDADTNRNYPVVFLHDQAPWDLFGELALAEGIIFSFNSNGQFELRNSYVSKNLIFDDFNRDEEGVSLGGSTPARTANYISWIDAPGVNLYCEDSVASTKLVTDLGVASMVVPYQEMKIKTTVGNVGSQGLRLFAGVNSTDGSDGIGIFIDGITGTLTTFVFDVEDTPISCGMNDGDEIELSVSLTDIKVYVDNVLKKTRSIPHPIYNDNRATGVVIVNQSSSGELTTLKNFSILPIDDIAMTFDGTTNIESGSTRSEVWTNEVVVKVSEFSKDGHGTMRLWGPDNPTILSYARLLTGINSTDTTISVEREVRQENGSLIDNGWPQYDGILFFPVFSGGKCIGGELIKYESRTERAFKGCQRGYAGTTAVSHSANAYIGEAREWEIEFDGKPALSVKWPFATAIDTYLKEPGLSEQAYIPFFDHDAFTGKLIIANIAKYLTWLEGTGQSIQDYDDKKEDIELNHTTSVAGVVAIGGENKQKVVRKLEDPTAKDLERIRRYGRNKVEITSQWIQSREHGQQIADSFIAEYSDPRLILNLSAVAAPLLELGDRVTVSEYENMVIVDNDYHVIEIKSSYDGGLSLELTLREVL